MLGGSAAVLVLAGCGGGGFADESAQTIVDETEKDMKALSSLSMSGDITTDGQKLGLDMSLDSDGNCQGTLDLQQGSAQILSIDGKSWLKADAAFWQSTAGSSASMVQQIVGDKWVVMPASESGFTDVCDLDSLLSQMGDDNNDKGATVGDTEEVDGQETVKVTTKTDQGDPATAWVTTDDPHYILKMQVTQGSEPGQITFSDFNDKLDLTPPADDEVVDLSKLGG